VMRRRKRADRSYRHIRRFKIFPRHKTAPAVADEYGPAGGIFFVPAEQFFKLSDSNHDGADRSRLRPGKKRIAERFQILQRSGDLGIGPGQRRQRIKTTRGLFPSPLWKKISIYTVPGCQRGTISG
jgi:hypothetical protein